MPNKESIDIQLLTNQSVFYEKNNRPFKGKVSFTDKGNFCITNEKPIPLDQNDLNNSKLLSNPKKNKDKIKSKKQAKYKKEKDNSLYNFINQNYSNVMVLAGAGSSISGDPKNTGLPMSKLAKKINSILNKKKRNGKRFYNLLQMAQISHFDAVKQKSYKFNEDSFNRLVFSNFEDVLSNLNRYHYFVSNKDRVHENGSRGKLIEKTRKVKPQVFNDTIIEIHKLIFRECNISYKDSDFAHAEFIRKLSMLNHSDERLKIYSTNYDTLFEQAATNADKMFVIDGFNYGFPRTFNEDSMNIDFISRKNDDRELDASNTKLCPNVIKIFQLHGSEKWYRDSDTGKVIKTDSSNAYNKIFSQNKKSKKYDSCMIFPSSNKYEQSYENPYFDLFSQFQKDLRKKSTLLIVVGFSFGDMHIRRMVLNAMLLNKGLNMVFLSYKGKDKSTGIKEDNHSTSLEKFYDSKLLSQELFLEGDLSSFANKLDLKRIYK